MFKKLSKPLNLLIASLIVVIIASFSASLVQNSFFKVDVSNVKFETANGELAGLLYIPDGVDSSNPVPAVVLTHGYLNNKEMQEIAAIELSRRGYVVLAFDMYDHGDSVWETPAQFSFYVQAVFDAATYMYAQDYVLKDAAGNGMIGVSGHSMGGFSSETAVILDEMSYGVTGVRMISAMLALGSDFRYVPFADPISYIGSRSAGVVASHYDQFFFDNVSDPAEGSVHYKDYTTDPVGLAFLDRTFEGSAEAETFYHVAGGQRVIYTPDETHPQNTWSLETGGYTIDFFETAFAYQLDQHDLGDLESYGITVGNTGQVWWLKEMFTLIALLALIAMIFPLYSLLTTLPLFNKSLAEEQEEAKGLTVRVREKTIVKVIVTIIATLLSTYYITIFMDRSAGLATLANITLYIAGISLLVVITVWVVTLITKGTKGENYTMEEAAGKVTMGAAFVILISLCYRWVLTNTDMFTTGVKWGAPSVNTIVYWALASAGLILLVTVITSFYFNQGEDVKNPYGLNTTPVKFGASVLTAIVMVIAVLLVVAIISWVFLTDFRFYTYAIQIFNWPALVESFRYMPAFFVFYFAAGVSVFANTRGIKRQWLGDIYAAFLLAGPVILFLIYNYHTLYSTGVAAYPTFSLSAILTVGLVPTLAFAGIIIRRISLKTGTIWTGVFFSAIFFTIITLANTAIYQLIA